MSSVGLFSEVNAFQALQMHELLPETDLYIDAYLHVNPELDRQIEDLHFVREFTSNLAKATAEHHERWGFSRFRRIEIT